MSHTARYRQQHAEIMRLATELGRKLTRSELLADLAGVRKLLSELSGKIIVHLAAEDTVLYPQMLRSKDPAAQKLAKQLLEEMGPIAQAFKSYAVRWGSETQIRSNPEAFAEETRSIIKALSERIHKENMQLYPLADRL